MCDNNTTLCAYRAALALNNMSVSMLQHGEYELAVKTLCDSLLLLRMVFRPPQPVPSSDCSCASTTGTDSSSSSPRITSQVATIAADKLQQATQRLLEASCSNKKYQVLTDVHALDDQDFAQIRAASCVYGPSASVVFAIRVRESLLQDDHPAFNNGSNSSSTCNTPVVGQDMERKFGIVLYNHGLAHFLVSLHSLHQLVPGCHTMVGQESPQEQKRNQCLTRANRSLTLSHLAHSRCLGGPSQQQEQQDEPHVVEAFPSILLSALALNCLSFVLEMQQDRPKALEARQAASGLVSMIEEDFFASFFSSPSTNRVVAPAA